MTMTKTAGSEGGAGKAAVSARAAGPVSFMGCLQSGVDWCRRRDEIVRVSIVALIGTIAAWLTYEIVFLLNGIEPRATVSWSIAFVIGIFRQHHLHRVLSFPENALPYAATLKRDIVASIGVFLLSTALIYTLTEFLGLHHRPAWLAGIIFVALFEYLVLKFFVFPQRRRRRRSHRL